MRICLDIGNTMAKIVFFGQDGKIIHRYQTKTQPAKSYDEYSSAFALYLEANHLNGLPCDGAIVSSVVPSLTPVFSALVKEVFFVEPKVLGPGIKSGIAVKTDNPREVGADLIAGAVGAKALFGGDVVIADMGTANKMTLLDERGDFVGCSIAPGLGLGLDALVDKTAALTDVSLQLPAKIIGKNTPDSMNSGLLYGNAFQIREMAKQIQNEVGKPLKMVLTGGYSHYVQPLLPEFVYEPDLIALGLYEILKRY